MNNTTGSEQLSLVDLSMYAIEVFDTVRVRWSDGHTVDGIVTYIDDELHSNGRRCCIVAPLADARDMAPFTDQLTLVKKYIGRAVRPVATMSDDTAARFAAYARAR
jgi:hypothetical protein